MENLLKKLLCFVFGHQRAFTIESRNRALGKMSRHGYPRYKKVTGRTEQCLRCGKKFESFKRIT